MNKRHGRAHYKNANELNYFSILALSICVTLGLPGYADADLVHGAVSITTTTSNFAGVPTNTTDQSGLSANYVSGVTDFDSFVGSTTHEGPSLTGAGNYWSGDDVDWSADFDLGANLKINRLAIWNFGGSASLRGFTLEASTVSDFSTFDSLGSFTLDNGTNFPNHVPQTLTFSATDAQYFRISDTTNGGAGQTGLLEIVFSQTAVPEPGSFAMFTLGLVGLGFVRRRTA